MSLPLLSDHPSPQRFGFHAQLDDLLLRLAVAPGRELNIQTAEPEAQRIETSEVPEEFTTGFGETYARTEFHGGVGLDRAHQRDLPDGAYARFWDCEGVVVPSRRAGRRSVLTLFNDIGVLEAGAGATADIVATSDALYVSRADDVWRFTDPTNVNATHTTSSLPGTVLGLAVLGTHVFAAVDGDGIHRRTTSWASYNALAAQRVWAAKGRLFAAVDEALYEVVDTTTPTTPLVTLPEGGTWVGVCDAGAAVLAASSDGYVYAFRADDDGVLGLAGQTLFEGEAINAIAAAQGLVFVATRQGPNTASVQSGRLWRGQLDGDFTLNGGEGRSVVYEWLDGTVRSLTADREYVYALAAQFDGAGTLTHQELWRYDLADAALFRLIAWTPTAAHDRDHIGVAGGRIWVHTADGLARTLDTYQDSGFLITPFGDFYSADVKVWVSAIIETYSVPTGTTVELYYTSDPDALLDPSASAWVRVAQITGTNPGSQEVSLPDVRARGIAGMIRLEPNGDGTSAPQVDAVSFRAYPSASEIIVELPVNISDRIESRGRQPITVRGRGAAVYAALQAKQGKAATLRLWRPSERLRGVVEKVGTPVQGMSRRGSVTTYAVVQFRGRRVSEVETSVGAGPWGSFLWGSRMWGGVDE